MNRPLIHDIADRFRHTEAASRVASFNHLAWLILRSGGSLSRAREITETDRRWPTPSAVVDVLKADVGIADLSEASAFRGLAAAFADSLKQVSVFDALLAGGMVTVPFRTRVIGASTAATGEAVAEAKPVGRIAVAADTITPRKTTATIVVSNESLEAAPGGMMSFIGRELRRALAVATDGVFLDALAADITAGASTTPVADLATLLGEVSLGADSRPFLVVSPDVAKGLAVATDTGTTFLFPQMTPTGGSVLGMPVLVTDALAAGTMMLIDASAFVAGTEPIRLNVARHASIQMNDDPADAAAALTSLWQTNSSGIRVERWFGWHLERAVAVAMVDGITWGVNPASGA